MNNIDGSHNQSLIRLSQAQLNLLELCPPQFQRVYLEQLGSPMSPERQEHLLWGNQFHQLMQQHFLGLSIDSILDIDQELKKIVQALLKVVKEQHNLNSDPWTEAEHYLALEKDNYLLTAIYDLLIINENKAQILDWKTYLKPQNKQKLEKNWQTKLYLYLLAETSDYLPEQISMTYWFVKIPHHPQYLRFEYNQELHDRNTVELESLLTNLDKYLLNYSQNNVDFPHRRNCESNCPYYQLFFPEKATFNHRENEKSNLLSIIDDIEEVSI
ncbi:unknown [Crocosphaera subtropica ATCC 51142]|uniref:PD-(D/E)XK endonuclease-like domain-containing protein n=1 Tax=Crocosphaera subtropica (strain ATCC 51142 / BH68) TaxID=43989 RepID=B1WXU5_CROS5|nr:PD-(D/E)XK nuclease family protein [Crocosphaera subtropica]ACB50932.1 unknown [Crocosphaera subtropica ATCC 51142]